MLCVLAVCGEGGGALAGEGGGWGGWVDSGSVVNGGWGVLDGGPDTIQLHLTYLGLCVCPGT